MLSADAIGNMHTEKQVATVTKRKIFNIKEILLFLTPQRASIKLWISTREPPRDSDWPLELAASPEGMCKVAQDLEWLDPLRSSGAEAFSKPVKP
jgi:hypothetical protein